MVILEILSHAQPYAEVDEAKVIGTISGGGLPAIAKDKQLQKAVNHDKLVDLMLR